MTFQQRIMSVFQGRRVDVMPWFADLTYWYAAAVARDGLEERYHGAGVVQLYRDLNVGCHEHALNSPWKLEYPDVEITTEEQTDSNGRPRRQVITWQTPVGAIEQIKEYEPVSYSWAYLKYPVATAQDLRVLRFIFENQRVTPDYTNQERQIQMWGDMAACASLPPRTPLANLIVIWMGVLNVVYALADFPDQVEATLEVMAAADDPIYDIICHSPAPLVYIPDNITAEVVNPTLFEKYYTPYYQKRHQQIHAAGKYTFVHVDGTMRGVLERMAATGADCAQSLTPAPVGDVPVGEMRALAGPDLILWGGVPAAYFSEIYPEQALADIVMECIQHHLEPGNFILGVCDQVPPDGDIRRVKLVSDLVEEHARY
ncbi:MAG: uroporphyrinogen decarboxylase family protein [Armatimonadota bacterium]